MRNFSLLACVFLSFCVSHGVSGHPKEVIDPREVLKKQNPGLFEIDQRYVSLDGALSEYANRQGFRAPFEHRAILVHEKIHILQAAAQGFYHHGIFYEPYLNSEHWPKLKNAQVLGYIQPVERSVITSTYMPATPENNLGNVIDEINAYAETHVFICRNEPQSIEKQRTNLIGFLRVVEAYLRTLKQTDPGGYERFAGDEQGAGAVETFVFKAWEVLVICGASTSQFRFPEVVQFIRYHQMKVTGMPGK